MGKFYNFQEAEVVAKILPLCQNVRKDEVVGGVGVENKQTKQATSDAQGKH